MPEDVMKIDCIVVGGPVDIDGERHFSAADLALLELSRLRWVLVYAWIPT